MNATGVAWTPGLRARAARGYDSELHSVKLSEWKQPGLMPAGALHSTVNDHLKLARAALDKETSPLAAIAFDETAAGLDWGSCIRHEGGISGFSASFYADRREKRVLVVLGNTISNQIANELAWRIRNILERRIVPGLNLPGMNLLPVAALPAAVLKQYRGKFRIVKSGFPGRV